MVRMPPIRVVGGIRLVTGPAHRARVAPDQVQLDLLSHVRASILDRRTRAATEAALVADGMTGDEYYFEGKVAALDEVLEDLDGAPATSSWA